MYICALHEGYTRALNDDPTLTHVPQMRDRYLHQIITSHTDTHMRQTRAYTHTHTHIHKSNTLLPLCSLSAKALRELPVRKSRKIYVYLYTVLHRRGGCV